MFLEKILQLLGYELIFRVSTCIEAFISVARFDKKFKSAVMVITMGMQYGAFLGDGNG